jgi:excisionase family DNA binding protein
MENPFELIIDRLDKIEKSIESLKSSNNLLEKENDIFFSIDELSEYLKISKSSIYGFVHRKKIPYYKFSRSLNFKKTEIDLWINSKKTEIKPDIDQRVYEYFEKTKFFK